jgi:hypothetical protein
MNKAVRNAVQEHLDARKMTRTEAAAAAGMTRQYLQDMMTLRKATVPRSWARLLDVLDLEVVVRPKRKPKGEPTG